MSKEEATTQINAIHFPVVEEGDKAGHEGYTFIYTSGKWVAQE
tara:strand:- start:4474 stop:4602 length:129 start_codon:yes stop_codon:yes gene_type:complete